MIMIYILLSCKCVCLNKGLCNMSYLNLYLNLHKKFIFQLTIKKNYNKN